MPSIPQIGSRNLNKKLGTRVLVSEPVLNGAQQDFLLRDVGHFLLRGKALPVHAFELIGPLESAGLGYLELCERFARALAFLRKGESRRPSEPSGKSLPTFPTTARRRSTCAYLEFGAMFRNGALKVD